MTDEHAHHLFAVLKDHQVAIVEGPTGSGKSTFLPFRLVQPPGDIPADRFTRHGQVLVTQPRIQAARNIPAWVAENLYGGSLGSGFDLGFRHKNNPYSDWRNKLVYVTDGTLINWIIGGQLANLSVIVIDEAHERSLIIDVILGLLKRVLPRYPNLRLVIASATIDTDMFLRYFAASEQQLIRSEEKRKFDVKEWCRGEDADEAPLPYDDLPRLLRSIPIALADKIMQVLLKRPPGDVLGFLQGVKPIREAVARLRSLIDESPELRGNVDVLPLYTVLPPDEQARALQPKTDKSRIRVVITTNVAETSLTVEDVVYVVDSGLINQQQWDLEAETKQVPPALHSRAGCRQRWGRAGRTCDGEAFCLYTREQFENLFPAYTVPQIQRSSLEQLVLQTKAAGIDSPETFDWLESPPSAELERATRRLKERGALDEDEDLTERGLEVLGFGDEPALANLLIEADRHACAIEMAAFVAIIKSGRLNNLLTWDPDWSAETRREVTRVHNALRSSCRDDVEFCLKLYYAWSESTDSGKSFAAGWAFDSIWPARIPALTKEMTSSLEEPRNSKSGGNGASDTTNNTATSFLDDVEGCRSAEELKDVVRSYGLEKVSVDWTHQALAAMADAHREAWAKTFFVNHSHLRNKVEPEREVLLESLSGFKKEEERRPVDFGLIDRVRLVIALCLPEHTYARSADADGRSVAKPWSHEELSRAVVINNDSACYQDEQPGARLPAFFIAASRQVIVRRVNQGDPLAEVLHLSYICEVQSDWLERIHPKGSNYAGRSVFGLGRLIADETRDSSGSPREAPTMRLLADQFFPLRATYACRVAADEMRGRVPMSLGARLAEPTPVIERRSHESGAEDEEEQFDGLDDQLVDTILRPEEAVADPDDPIEPSWPQLFEPKSDPLSTTLGTFSCEECGSSVKDGTSVCPECGYDLFPTDEELERLRYDVHQPGELEFVLIRDAASLLVGRVCLPCKWIVSDKDVVECPLCGRELSELPDDSHTVGEEVVCRIVGYDFSDESAPTALLASVGHLDPFDAFVGRYTEGDHVPALVIDHDRRPGQHRASLVVRETFSGLETVLEPGAVAAVDRGAVVTQIPLHCLIWPVVEEVDEETRQVSLSLLPAAEAHLNRLLEDVPRRRYSYQTNGVVIEVVAGPPARLYARLDGSEPNNGIVHAVEVGNRGLPRSIESYREGERFPVELSYPDMRPSWRYLDSLPADVLKRLGVDGAFAHLAWDGARLSFDGRMPYGIYGELLAASNDARYRLAIANLYRMRQLRGNLVDTKGWEDLAKRYPLNSKISGVVANNQDFGVFVEIESGVEGLVRTAELMPNFVGERGARVNVRVKRIDIENRQIELSMRDVE